MVKLMDQHLREIEASLTFDRKIPSNDIAMALAWTGRAVVTRGSDARAAGSRAGIAGLACSSFKRLM